MNININNFNVNSKGDIAVKLNLLFAAEFSTRFVAYLTFIGKLYLHFILRLVMNTLNKNNPR